MLETIELLVKLQAIELEAGRFATVLKKLPAELAAAEATLKKAQTEAATAEKALAEEEALRARCESQTAVHRQKAERLEKQLDTVKTPAQAAAVEHEIGFAREEADKLENEAFASLERSETQETALQTARAAIDERTANLTTIRASVAQREAECKQKIGELHDAGALLRPQIEAEALARFDRIARSRGTGIAKAENQQCTGCQMGIRLPLWSRLREGEMIPCDSCGRLLYWAPQISSAAEPRPELAPGAGRALRRTRQA